MDKRDPVFVAATLLMTLILFFLPTGFSRVVVDGTASARARALVTKVDNSMIKIIGPVKEGEQQLEIKIISGKFRGRVFQSTNNLMGKMEVDKLFAPGDRVLVVLDLAPAQKVDGAGDGTSLVSPSMEVAYANVIDHYRTDKTIFLVLLFFVMLVAVTGWVGVKTAAAFAFTGTVIVKALLPAMLLGWNPVLATLGITALLTAVIIFLVGGFTRKALVAFIGSISGVVLTSALAAFFTGWFHLHGAVRPFAESLLYSGYGHLDITGLFVSGIFLASSGAVMDLAMDIAAAMSEVKEHDPGISRGSLIASGLTVARYMTGTLTTTLLLAYSAEYTAMLMTFIAQGVPFENVVNMVFVSSEIVHTLAGCFGIVLVAPLTAVAGGFVLGRAKVN
jgi:uncharacterized membrane protein